jgi:hypothetical protein
MSTGANVGQRHYNTQQFYHQSKEMCEYPENRSVMTLTPAMRENTTRSNCAQDIDMPVDISFPTHMQSLYSPQSQYPTTPPSYFDESYQSPRIHGGMAYSRYVGVHLSPPYAAYHHPEVHHSGKRRLPPPAVSFRDPFSSHQNHRAYVHSSPPTSPTDIREFHSDTAVLRRQQGGQ